MGAVNPPYYTAEHGTLLFFCFFFSNCFMTENLQQDHGGIF